MKKYIYLAFAAAACFTLASCKDDYTPEPAGPAVIRANYTSLTKGDVKSGESVNTLPVSATSESGTISLNFFTDKVYLPEGTYTLGTENGCYNGHFKGDKLDADFKAGTITVSLEGETDYSISGTVRLSDAEGTPLKIRAKGNMFYEFPTEYYYTEEKGVTVNGVKANVYKIYDIASSYQLAECAVVGAENGVFNVEGSGKDGTALYGGANSGCWIFSPGFGTHVMLHGTVTLNESHGKKNFIFSDTVSGAFPNCELKQDIVPNLNKSNGDISFMTLKYFSAESPVVKDMYELTIKMYYTDGCEFMSFTALTQTPNPILEVLKKEGDSTGGLPFMPVSYDDYVAGPAPNSCISTTAFYVCDGVKYPALAEEGFAMVTNTQMANSPAGLIIAGLVAPTNMSYSLPAPLNAYLTSVGGSIWNLMGYYFP